MKKLRMMNGEVVDDAEYVCPACETPRHSTRYAEQWTVNAGTAVCPTCGTEVEDVDA